MEDFRVKLKRPGKIQNFDDSDLSDYLGSTESSSPRVSPPAVKSQTILPKSVPNHLLLVSILEQLCHMYSKDSKQAQDIFYTICNQLSKANVVSPLLILDEMSSLRTQYRLSVHKMLIAAIHKSNKGLSLQLAGSKSNGFPAITYSSMTKEPTNNPEDLVNQTSRYKTEFVEVDRIGRGGFGSVFKSRNKLDGNIYAVKKVKFKHSKPEVWYKVLREVKALAFLHHYNVVGYNAAWLEYEPIKLLKPDVVLKSTVEERTDSQSLDSIIFQDSQNGYLDYHPRLNTPSGPKIREITSDVSGSSSSVSIVTESKSVKLVRNNSTTDIVKFSQRKSVFETEFQTDFVSSKYSESNSTFNTAFNRNIHKDTIVSKTPKVEFSLNTDSTEVEDFSSSRRYGRSISCDLHATGEAQVTLPVGKQEFVESAFAIQQSVTLYIQMELCDLSLKEWLQKRNDSCMTQDDFLSYVEKNMIIFRQILKGVDFIHSQGVIHRDIKPRNIFLIESDVGMHVKIGDFGLATDEVVTSPITEEPNLPRVTSAGKLTRSASSVSDHTSGVGTSTYAAPEQLQGSLYNTKSDIYSLGVVLYELFMHFRTESERIRSLDDLRKGIIEDKIFEFWPAQAHCIQQMTNHKAELRPSIKDLLLGELFLSKDQIIEDLKAKTESQQKEIERLRRLLADRDRTIEELTKSIPFQDSNLTSAVI